MKPFTGSRSLARDANLRRARGPGRALGSLSFAALVVAQPCVAQPVPSHPLDTAMHEQVVMLPAGSGLASVDLQTTIFKPPGDGPFPLLIMNHGKAPGDSHFQERARYLVISREFVKRGYAVVIPMRTGFAGSGGSYVSGGCYIAGNGMAQAKDLRAALDYSLKQPWVDSRRVLVAGQSHGGLTALAFGASQTREVKGIINFAGGLRLENCPWKNSLVDAIGKFGATTQVPSLWFYGKNDSYFDPELAARMHAAYTASGAKAHLVAYDAFKSDAHGMSSSRDGVKIWWPETEKFLKQVGLPAEPHYSVSNAPTYARTDFARVDEITALPHVRDTGREGYRQFLKKPEPRAFAISPTGAWGYAFDGDDPALRALANCQKHSKSSCQLYAVDDDIVWKDLF
jgi:dienelactone hydrolase